MPRLSVYVFSLVLTLAFQARAGEVSYQFQTQEDPKAADPSLCQGAPFQANVKLPGIIFVPEREASGKLKAGAQKAVGKARACALVTDRTFAEGSQADMFASFDLPEGHFTAVGKCTALSNAVPRAGVVLVGCALKLTEFPKAYVGGVATSSSLFNPMGLPGYSSGSLWTLRLFEPEKAPSGAKAPAPAPAK